MTTKRENPTPQEFQYNIPLEEFKEAFDIPEDENLSSGLFQNDEVILITTKPVSVTE